MNYQKIYDDLINRAQNRTIDCYVERHHIVPRCMGGDDSATNLVNLTPEEHYVAHQLLVKIHPKNGALIRAAQMMIPNRPSNKLYGWLRRKFSDVQKTMTEEKNSQWGTRWIHNLTTQENKKIKKTIPLPDGWTEGRKLDWSIKTASCVECGAHFTVKVTEKFCSDNCKQLARYKRSVAFGREEEFLAIYDRTGSMNLALKEMGLQGAVGGWYRWGKNTLSKRM